MKNRTFALRWLGILIMCLSLTSTPSGAQDGTPAFDYEQMEKRVSAFLAAYGALDLKGMVEHYHPQVVFIDDTAQEVGATYRMTGKEEIQQKFAEFMPSIFSLKIDVQEHYFSGPVGVYRGVYHAEVAGAAVGLADLEKVMVDYPFITVFEFKDGLISKHTDYVNYPKMRRQMASRMAAQE